MRTQAVVLAYSLLASALLCRRAAASPALIVGKLVVGGEYSVVHPELACRFEYQCAAVVRSTSVLTHVFAFCRGGVPPSHDRHHDGESVCTTATFDGGERWKCERTPSELVLLGPGNDLTAGPDPSSCRTRDSARSLARVFGALRCLHLPLISRQFQIFSGLHLDVLVYVLCTIFNVLRKQ